jgi:hypothetical protein
MPPLIDREHSLHSPTVEPTVRYCSSLSRHRVRRFSIYCIAGVCEEHFPNIGAHRGARIITCDGWKENKHHKTSGRALQERKTKEGRAEHVRDRGGRRF